MEEEKITLIQEFTVSQDEAGVRLDLLLLRKYPILNREQWQERIRNGDVTVDRIPGKPSRRIREGELIAFRYWKKKEPPVEREFHVVYRDPWMMVLNKPANLPVHPSGAYFKHTLYFLLKERFGESFPTHFIHRLDRETSGLMVLALHKESAALLQKSFLDHAVRKEYLVLVEGRLEEPVIARGFLHEEGRGEVRKKRTFTPANDPSQAKAGEEWASTDLYPVCHVGPLTLVRAELHTGRMHQIRATLCSLGYPVVGDRLYGVDESLYVKFIEDRETDEDRNRLRMSRTALHSFRLGLPHPETGEWREFRTDLPRDMLELIRGFEPGFELPSDGLQ